MTCQHGGGENIGIVLTSPWKGAPNGPSLTPLLFGCLSPPHPLVCTLLLTTPLPALTEGNFTYEASNDQATITDFPESYAGDLVIPATLVGYPVTSIGDLAFEDCSYLTSVTIPEGVTTIGATVKVVKVDGEKRYDITQFLDLPAAVAGTSTSLK